MKLRAISAIALLVSAIHATPSMAFGLPSIPSIGGGSAGASASVNVDALTKQQAELLVAMAVSLRNLSQAQAMMFNALGDQEDAAIAQRTADGLTSGTFTGKDDMKKTIDSSLEANDKMKSLVATASQMSAESKALFTKSLVPYAAGAAGLVVAGKKAADAGQSLTHTMDPTVLFKLGSLLYVAKEAPTLASAFGNTTSQIVTYATSQGVDTKAITAAAANLGN